MSDPAGLATHIEKVQHALSLLGGLGWIAREEAEASLAALVLALQEQQEALEAVDALLPDGQHPGVREFEDRITAAKIIVCDALGNEDCGNVGLCYTLAADFGMRWPLSSVVGRAGETR